MNTRGRITLDRMAKLGLAFVVALAITALITALVLPIGINAINDDNNQTVTQDVGTTENITPVLDATLDSTSAGSNATYTLNTTSGDSETNTIDVGSETTYTTLSEGDVTVGVTESNSGDATAYFVYAKDYGWSSGASAIWAILDVILVLAVFLFIMGVAVAAVELL